MDITCDQAGKRNIFEKPRRTIYSMKSIYERVGDIILLDIQTIIFLVCKDLGIYLKEIY